MPYFSTQPLAIVDKPADARHTAGKRSVSAISRIVLHATAGGLASSLDWLTVNANSQVSAHVVIDRDGTIYKLVPDDVIANHAGYSRVGNTSNLNPISLGIELVNSNSGSDPFPDAQLRSCAAWIVEKYGLYGFLPIDSHAAVDTQGKSDPRGLDWPKLYGYIADALRVALGGGQSAPKEAYPGDALAQLQGEIAGLEDQLAQRKRLAAYIRYGM